MHSEEPVQEGTFEVPEPRSSTAQANAPLRVLSLTGGGYRGLFTARTLVALCTQARKKGSLESSFDVFAGTSIGGLMSCALAVGVLPNRVLDAIDKHGGAVFAKRRGGSLRQLFFGALYDSDNLAKAVKECLGAHANTKLSSIDRGVLVPSIDWLSGQVEIFLSGYFGKARASDATLQEICMATSAAPTYFESAEIDGRPMLDGGLAANNPDTLALLQIIRRFPHAIPKVEMLSIGTAGYNRPRDSAKANRSALGWASDLPTFMIDVQESTAAAQARDLLGPRYLRINHPGQGIDAFEKLDSANDEAREHLLQAADEAARSAYGQSATFIDRMLTGHRAP
jgi:patatin-like phospholipase/acyl hydrolase